MKIIKIDLKNPSSVNSERARKEQIDLIVDYFKRGKVVVYPADTIYGIGCIWTNEKAIEKIHKMKKIKNKKIFIILVSSFAMIKRYFKLTKKQLEYCKKKWPGYFSLIYKKTENAIRMPKGTAGLPNNDFLIKILRRVGAPVVSTSLNITGKEPLASLEEIENYFKIKPDLVVDVGEIKNRKASQVLDIRNMDDIKILRK